MGTQGDSMLDHPTPTVGAAPKKPRKKPRIIVWTRFAVRVLTFLLLPILFIDTYNVLRTLIRALAAGTDLDFASLAPQFLTLVLLFGSALLVGRVFCGWMCAFGSFGDLVHRVGRFFHLEPLRIDPKSDRRMKYVKYGILLVPVVFAALPGSPDLSATSPWDAFGMLLSSGLVPDFASVAIVVPIGLFLLLLVTVGSLFIERFFCRYLCPLGAVFSILSRGRGLTLEKPSAKCGGCRICTNRCSMGIPLDKVDSVVSGECIQCMECVEACPRKNITPLIQGRKVKPLTAALAAVCVLSTVGFLLANTIEPTAADSAVVSITAASTDAPTSGTTSPSASSLTATPTVTVAPTASTSLYKDGTYEGTGTGFRNRKTTVSVTIMNGAITSVEVVSYGDDRKWFVRAFQTLVDKVLAKQAAVTDIVAGATYSSRGIDAAVADALSKAV
jgi:polyferredoxin/major membrane immunogen (membrane-anchored lipoprotein)